MSNGRGRWWTEARGSGGRARAASFGLAVLVAASGCGTVCDEAAETMEECGYLGDETASEASCEGAVRCASACAAEVPCGAFDGTDPAAFDQYKRCIDAC